MLDPETIIGGRYQITGKLGKGGFSQTYRAIDLHQPAQLWAVKEFKIDCPFMREKMKPRFDREAAILKRCNHDRIPKYLDYFQEKQHLYLVQEFIDGQTLEEEFKRQRYSETKAIGLLREVLNILAYTHQQGIIHRDIKPANLMRRRRDGKIFLIDFGAVKEIPLDSKNQILWTIAIGTPIYMPPEQMAGRPIPSSDLYALGMTVIQALTGECCWNTDRNTGNVLWHSGSVNPNLANVLNQMIRCCVKERYRTAAAVLNDLG